ncbi:glycoside-pentoside-hexuronide (GPH):cation symporter [Christensenella tenuis]|uniref:MFS transporter n=1 Tax=Christensenella tenuis TaxID=2763033 RepID=A0ABR7EJN5_9FIRM|nr:glycoside-pentoside-hexuronide (GPH):cation symporter [Christensenella tenuis]MBC5649378.1 MFS transporter [Christensenella tenuis]
MAAKNTTQPAAAAAEPVSKPIYHGKEAVWRKMAFASGDITYNFPWMLVSSFLMFFMTDIALIPAAVVSILFLVCRVFDAVNDPLIGILADRTHTRFGRYRPWLLASGIPLVVSVILLFWAHPEWPEMSRTIYGCVMYCIAVVFATMWNIPYGGLMASLTPDPTERASFASYKILFSSVTCAIASSIFLPLTNMFGAADGDPVNGYLIGAVIVCALAVPFIFTCFFGTKEVVHPPKNQKIKAKALFQVIGKNPPLLIVVVSFFIFGFISYGRMTVAVYYFQYNVGDPTGGLFSIYALLNGVLAGIMAFFGARLMKVFKSKRNTILFGYMAMAILCIITYLMDPATVSSTTIMVLLLASGLVSGISSSMIYAMVPDTVEYGQWKSGIRADGFVYSGTSFMLKLGGAIAPTLLAALIAMAGYVPGAAQNADTLNVMNSMMNLMPAILSILGFVIFLFYKLDGKMHARILADLEARGDQLMD